MKIIAVIPARGGSKGIPKKNIRLLAGKPLISYVINTAKKCEYIDDIFVTTDSSEIQEIAEELGVDVLERSEEMADDATTLDPVIYDAVIRAEKIKGYRYDYVITIQATSPLLRVNTLTSAIKKTIYENTDAMISVVNKPHLSWKEYEGKFVPNYTERLNRQQLPPNYIETGAFVITRRRLITEKSRMEGCVSVYCVSEDESIDIDNKNDWILAEAILEKKKIVFRVDGYALLGMGHVYNCITLAYSMIEHDILLVIQKDSIEGIEKIKETNLPYRVIEREEEITKVIEEYQPDIWVQDKLDTDVKMIRYLKSLVPRVITIEDKGAGAIYADAVINALYTDADIKGENIYNGWKYVCLRDEFQIEQPSEFSDEIKDVMIMFGGTDPSNYNQMLYNIILRISNRFPDVKFNFVLGIGYDAEKNGLYTRTDKNVYVYSNVQRVTKYMKCADIAISSQGRAIFEFASMGVPTIILSQNAREKTHSFADMRNGFINLGMCNEIDIELIENTLNWLINTKTVRKNMHDLMLEYPLREGLGRVKKIILGENSI